MPQPGTAARLTLYLDGTTLWHHRPAYAEIVHRARQEGLAGASVFHGLMGFGADGHIHSERAGHLRAKGPCAVMIVDDEQRLRAFLERVADVLEKTAALVILDPVHVPRRGTGAGTAP